MTPLASLSGDLWTMALGLFLAGLSGGAVHCLGMCGPFVMAQVSATLERVPAERMGEMHRLRGGLLVPYHLGRMTTYTALGVLVAVLSQSVAVVWDLRWLAFALLVLAATVFVVQALKGWGVPLPGYIVGRAGGNGATAEMLGRLAAPLFRQPTGWRGYLLGVMLGFIPCGLVYGALAASAASDSVLGAVVVMLAFSLGTMPGLMGLGVAGQLAATRLRGVFKKIGPVFLLFSAGLLVLTAWRAVGAV